MGVPGAGKSTVARELEKAGYQRLNRDARGGSLATLAASLDALLAGGARRVVLDNTYPTRKSRNEVIEAAWRYGAPVRCIWLMTDIGDAQINGIRRMLEAHGSLPRPEEIRRRAKADPRYLLPDAQFRYERALEAPTVDEGFTSVDVREFVRTPDDRGAPALILDFDDLLGRNGRALRAEEVIVDDARRATVRRHADAGWVILIHAWRPELERKETTADEVAACFSAMAASLGVAVDVSCCPHDAGPPACWCRKPIPGAVLELAARRGVALSRSTVVGASAADRTMAARLRARFVTSDAFFASQEVR